MPGLDAFDTPCLHLRPLDPGDEALYCRLYSDPDLMRHIAAPLSRAAAQKGFQASCRQQSADIQRWIIVERASGDDIGLLGLFASGDAAEIGVMLLAATQGRGYAAEAIAAMAGRAFAAPSLRRLWTRHSSSNQAAVVLMQKLGFRRWQASAPPAADPATAPPPGAGPAPDCRWQLDRARWQACVAGAQWPWAMQVG